MIKINLKTMLRLTLALSLALIFLSAYSQSTSSNEITAEGGSKIKIKPDVAIFTLTVEKSDTIEKDAIKKLNLEVDELVKTLYSVGFTNSVIKIADYNISSSLDDSNKKKYTASNVLKLEFGLDTKVIDALYKEIQEAGLSDLDVSYETQVSDSLEKNTRLILVQQALEDAKANAINISKSLNIKLINVKQVYKYKEESLDKPYRIETIKFTKPKFVDDAQVGSNTSFDKFEVADVELEEKITIVYEISK
jgi:uncharacterized protein YggE